MPLDLKRHNNLKKGQTSQIYHGTDGFESFVRVDSIKDWLFGAIYTV